MSDPPVGEAVVILVVRDGRVLAARRGPAVSDTGWWTFPTGTIDPGEHPATTVEREAEEELDLAVRAVREVWTCPTDDGRFRLRWWTTEVTRDRDPVPDGDEVDAVAWVDTPGFLSLAPTFHGDRRFVREVLPALLHPETPRPTSAPDEA